MLPPPSLAPDIDRNLFFLVNETRDILLTGALGLAVPLQAAALGQRGAGGDHHGPYPEHWLKAAPTRGNVRMGNILFGISFYLWCLFQLYCRFLMDSHFPCSFPIIQITFPNPCRHRLRQWVRHHWQPCSGSGEGQAHPLVPCPTTHQPLGGMGSCPNPRLLGGVGSVPGFQTGVVSEVINVLL